MDSRHDADAHARRLLHVEESLGFTDRTVEQLSEQIVALHREVGQLSRRLSSLERRLTDLQDGVTEAAPLVPPPHSAGPDVPKDPL